MKNEKYQMELDEFSKSFQAYKDKRMILYGIGRYTATLLEGLQGFEITGLMDKDPDNVGRTVFGLPVVDKAAAERSGDMVIINTSETYWDIIYDRICDMKLPIFFKNGEKALRRKQEDRQYPYGKLSAEELYKEIDTAKIVSFDFFDTLFMRSVCNPEDIFRLLELEIQKEECGTAKSFTELRNEAKKEIRRNYSLDELYSQMVEAGGLSRDQAQRIRRRELDLEKKLLLPRKEVLACASYAMEQGKEIYIISDMYLPLEFYRDLLEQYGLAISPEHILLSNVLDVNKSSGSMWSYYLRNMAGEKAALHIGDHVKADLEQPEKYGIKTCHVPCAWDMAIHSSMQKAMQHVSRSYDTAVAGCVLAQLFQNPYRLQGESGKVRISSNQEMGYCVFGPVILTFLLWVLERCREDHIKKLVFMARDGYFLKEDFEYLCERTGKRQECCYLGISRQLAMTASVTSREELLEYIHMPYTGDMAERMEDRLEIKLKEKDSRSAEDCMKQYSCEIKRYIEKVRGNYLRYLDRQQLDDSCAVVDLGYYGNNQKYLNKLLSQRLRGYYFNANLSKQNANAGEQNMAACFQSKDDPAGENSRILKKMIYLESLLTAPYGMIKAIDENGNFVCAEKKKNQEHFEDKREINRGVKNFIRDYTDRFGSLNMEINRSYIDRYYGYCFDGMFAYGNEVKQSFFNDNAMMNRIESMLFY